MKRNFPDKRIMGKKALRIFVRYINRSQSKIDIRFLDSETISFPSNDKIRLYLSRKYTDEGVNCQKR